ncbi:hypothetical protein MAPG_04597 [Magnaporthiopsis poae ATCC 64411]|uniref:Uncharacterized protein n=1 Tax=Magnaporthiopsis poae (strain ATCC 64411 / 73-15) TaxID=644358 RepID=A0A0C4DX59_MAGP6|nr:hypothetical protein MAPG_04597 [Magnaporthiopsis poae ATCC 64411]
MAPGFIERIQAKIELFRLEQRYTKRRNRRSTFVSNAVYVDGEYVYNTPTSTGSSTTSAGSPTAVSPSSQTAPRRIATTAFTTDNIPETPSMKPGKKLNRFSSMPGFGSFSKASGRQTAEHWRTGEASVSEVR